MDNAPVAINAGSEMPLVNRPVDAPTIYADIVSTLAVEGAVAKLSLSEYMPSPATSSMEARVVVNLVLSRGGLRRMIEKLATSLDQVEAAEQADSEGGQ